MLGQRQTTQSQLNFTQLELRSLNLVKRAVFGLFREKTLKESITTSWILF